MSFCNRRIVRKNESVCESDGTACPEDYNPEVCFPDIENKKMNAKKLKEELKEWRTYGD
jgi:predicted RNase H-like nuclease